MKLFQKRTSIVEWAVKGMVEEEVTQEVQDASDLLLRRLEEGSSKDWRGRENFIALSQAMTTADGEWEDRGLKHGGLALLTVAMKTWEGMNRDRTGGVDTLRSTPPEAFAATLAVVRTSLLEELDRR